MSEAPVSRDLLLGTLVDDILVRILLLVPEGEPLPWHPKHLASAACTCRCVLAESSLLLIISAHCVCVRACLQRSAATRSGSITALGVHLVGALLFFTVSVFHYTCSERWQHDAPAVH